MRRPRPLRRSTAPPGTDERVRVRATGPADLLALIPYQLGFHPSESVVAVFVRLGSVALVARVDLPAAASAPAFADDLRALARQHRAEEVVLFGYSDQPGPARAVLAGLVRALPPRLVRDVLYVDGTRWWSMTCADGCCPAEGTPYDVEGHPLAAEAVFAGMRTRASRDELVAAVSGPAQAELGELETLAMQVRTDRLRAGGGGQESAARLVALVQTGEAGLDDRSCAELASLVSDVALRDLAWAMIEPDNAETHLGLWLRVVSRVTPARSAGPLALAGIAGWISGDGAMLNCAADELSRRHPTYSMGRLLATISEQAISPRLWPSLQGGAHEALQRELERLAG